MFVAHLTGLPSEHLSLHASQAGAVAAILAEVRDAYRDRFSYAPTDLSARTRESLEEFGPAHTAAILRKVEDAATGAGWRASVEELEVAL